MLSGGPIGGDLLARRYRLIDRVGAGGMSVVWRARDEVLDRLVAVKWLDSELADDELFRDLVRREAWATARIKHPAVAAVYDYGEVSGGNGESLAYVVMEMLDGESLAARLRHGRLPWRESVAICAEVADALATAHEHGVVHRDISPDNVMLTSSGLRVFDFGIAAPIGEPDDDATGSTFGTPAYVAPERLDGQPAQTATDVYALGVLLFEMLTGDPPFPEDTWNPSAALTDRVPPRLRGRATAGLPPAVARLTRSCLAYDPARRPPAREVADRLAAYARPWWRGRAVFATVAAAAVVVAAAVAAAGSLGSASAPATTTPPAVAGALPTMPSASPPPASASASAPAPVGPTPAAAAGPTSAPPVPLSPAQALDQLRQILVTGQADGAIRSDVAQDLHNQVESIGTTLTLDPTSATLVQKIDSLRAHVLLRSTEQWGGSADLAGDPSRPPIAPACRDAMLAAIDTLKTAIMTA